MTFPSGVATKLEPSCSDSATGQGAAVAPALHGLSSTTAAADASDDSDADGADTGLDETDRSPSLAVPFLPAVSGVDGRKLVLAAGSSSGLTDEDTGCDELSRQHVEDTRDILGGEGFRDGGVPASTTSNVTTSTTTTPSSGDSSTTTSYSASALRDSEQCRGQRLQSQAEVTESDRGHRVGQRSQSHADFTVMQMSQSQAEVTESGTGHRVGQTSQKSGRGHRG